MCASLERCEFEPQFGERVEFFQYGEDSRRTGGQAVVSGGHGRYVRPVECACVGEGDIVGARGE